MAQFRLKRRFSSHGLTWLHEMRGLQTGRILGRITVWANSPEVVPELVTEFLIGSELLPEDWQEQIQSERAKDDEARPAGE